MMTDDFDPDVRAILEEAQRHGVIGRAPLASHIAQARAFYLLVEDLLSESPRVLDLGTGGGLPGLVIAADWPGVHMTLLDGRSSRAASLSSALTRVHLDQRVSVISERAEETGRRPELRGSFDLVVARGFGPPAVTAECAAPLLRRGGLLVVSDPPEGGVNPRWPVEGCAQLGMVIERTQRQPWALTVLRQASLCPPVYPRRTGFPLKRPLF